jgi:hypothetical protein
MQRNIDLPATFTINTEWEHGIFSELTVTVMHNLEIFDRGLCHPAMKVEHIALAVVIPHRCLVMQLYQGVHAPCFPAFCKRHTRIQLNTFANNDNKDKSRKYF